MVLALVLLAGSAHSAFAQDAVQAGSDLGSAVLQKYGSPEGIQTGISMPMTSSNTPMQTLDRSKSFSAQLACPSSSRFLEVLIQPSGTGDIATLLVSQDLDMDGSIDYSYSVPFPVSGICANGVIGCTPGTWENCAYWQWTVDASARISLAVVDRTALGGCYCVNTACGNGLAWTDLAILLKDLGGGVVGAVQAVNPKYAVTDARITDTEITYYGQGTGSCSRNENPSYSPESYYTGGLSGAALTNAKDTEVTFERSDPGSFYNLIAQSQAAQNNQGTFRSCSIVRNVTIRKETACPQADSQYLAALDKCVITANDYTPRLFSTGGGGSGCYFSVYLVPAGGTGLYISNDLCGDPWGGIGKNARIIYTCGGAQHILYTSENLAITLPACPTNDERFIQGYYYTTSFDSIDCSHYPNTAPFNGNSCIADPVRQDILDESVDDQCTAFEADTKCNLNRETVDNVVTVNNYLSTGLVPLTSCRDFAGFASHTVCRDWWKKDRVYFCETDAAWNFDGTKKRIDSIYTTTDYSSRTMYYTDLRKTDDSTWTTEAKAVQIGNVGNDALASCDQACKTRKPKADTQAGLSDTTTQYRNDVTSYDFLYRKCDGGVCPAGPDEEIVKSCQCLNDFAEATAVISALDAAGKDLICDGGVDPATGQCTGSIAIFTGRSRECRPAGAETSFFNCCDTDPGNFLFIKSYCGETEAETVQAAGSGVCHYVGDYCKKEWPLVGCVQRANTYCCFNSKLGRIIQEQGRSQLKTFPQGFGSPESPQCQGFTTDEFQMLDFSKIDLSEYFGYIKTKAATEMQQNMQEKVSDYYNQTQRK